MKMSKQINQNNHYKITQLWYTDKSQVDKSMWHYTTENTYHGVRMIPRTKTGMIAILMGIEARTNPGTIRNGEDIVRLVHKFATQVGMPNAEKTAKKYAWHYLNEGLLEEVVVATASIKQVA
jgi:hypothetical protein